jgi:hypothetical protein
LNFLFGNENEITSNSEEKPEMNNDTETVKNTVPTNILNKKRSCCRLAIVADQRSDLSLEKIRKGATYKSIEDSNGFFFE